jgi:hypothetical protein
MTAETERLCRAAHPEVARRAARGQSSASKAARTSKSRAGGKSKKTRPKKARPR